MHNALSYDNFGLFRWMLVERLFCWIKVDALGKNISSCWKKNLNWISQSSLCSTQTKMGSGESSVYQQDIIPSTTGEAQFTKVAGFWCC